MIEPIGDVAFWKLLGELNISWTANIKPYNCLLCENGPGFKLSVQNLTKQINIITIEETKLLEEEAKLTSYHRNTPMDENVETKFRYSISEMKGKLHILSEQKNTCSVELRKYMTKEKKYNLHLEQYETIAEEAF